MFFYPPSDQFSYDQVKAVPEPKDRIDTFQSCGSLHQKCSHNHFKQVLKSIQVSYSHRNVWPRCPKSIFMTVALKVPDLSKHNP